MEIKDSFNLFNLFLDKHVKIFTGQKYFLVRVPTIREFSTDDTVNSVYHILTASSGNMQKLLPVEIESSYDFIKTVLFQMAIYKEYSNITQVIKDGLLFFIPKLEIDYKNKELIVDDIIITEEI